MSGRREVRGSRSAVVPRSVLSRFLFPRTVGGQARRLAYHGFPMAPQEVTLRHLCCLVVMLSALTTAAAQPWSSAFSGVRTSLAVIGADSRDSAVSLPFRPTQAGRGVIALRLDFSAARSERVRAAVEPGLAGLAAVHAFDGQGAEWQRHYELGVASATIAYALDDRRGASRCWRAFAAGVAVGVTKEVLDGYFDWRDVEGTAAGAAVTALFAAVMPRWQW